MCDIAPQENTEILFFLNGIIISSKAKKKKNCNMCVAIVDS